MASSSRPTFAVPRSLTSRLRQGFAALDARRRPAELPARYRHAVPDEVIAAWSRLAPYDKHHLIAVAAELEREGGSETLVLAGLLHDVGKAGGVTVLDRVAAVILPRIAPPLASRAGSQSSPLPGLAGLHRLLNHAEAGARLLEREGMPAEVVRLVRLHELPPEDSRMTRLRIADERL